MRGASFDTDYVVGEDLVGGLDFLTVKFDQAVLAHFFGFGAASYYAHRGEEIIQPHMLNFCISLDIVIDMIHSIVGSHSD